MEKTYRAALVRDGVVDNVIVVEDESFKVDGFELVMLGEDERCGPGWCYDGLHFATPAEPEPEVKPFDQLVGQMQSAASAKDLANLLKGLLELASEEQRAALKASLA